jgi:hypothetical protein
LVAPLWERWLFYGRDRAELEFLQNFEERLLTQGDLDQFLDAILAAVRDHLQSPLAFVAALDSNEPTIVVMAGKRHLLDLEKLPDVIQSVNQEDSDTTRRQEFTWGNFWILPLYRRKANMDRDEIPPVLGILGAARRSERNLDPDQREALWLLADRAALALEDRRLQQDIFRSLEDIRPRVEMIQRMRAVGSYDARTSLLTSPLPDQNSLAAWVKDALTHYWGGPKLTDSPLAALRVVQDLAAQYEGNVPNALRALLRQAVDQIRPEGERRYTSEWMLFNILEMKFIEGRKVREVASRLAMSEADLYRKQRVAVEAVAKRILEMELQAKRLG